MHLLFRHHRPCPIQQKQMEMVSDGYFCQHCSKTVIDFSAMSDEAIIQFFQEKQTDRQNMCGRLTKQQLEKGVALSQKQATRLSALKKAAMITIVGLSMTGQPLTLKAQLNSPAPPPKMDTVLVDSAKIQVYEHPAEYMEIETKRLIYDGGLTAWVEIDCVTPPPPIPLSQVKKALKTRGYYQGKMDEVLDEATEKAIIHYRRKNGLSSVFEVDEALLELLGLVKKSIVD